MLAGCIIYSSYLDKHEAYEHLMPNSLYGWKFYGISMTIAIFSGVGMAVVIVFTILSLFGCSFILNIILSAVAVVFALVCAICEGIYYDTTVKSNLYQNKVLNRSKNVDYAKAYTKALWEHSIELYKAKDKAAADQIPSWDDELKKLEDGKHLLSEIYGESPYNNGFSPEGHEDPVLTFSENDNEVRASFNGGNQLLVALTYSFPTKSFKMSPWIFYWDDIVPTMKQMEFSFNVSHLSNKRLSMPGPSSIYSIPSPESSYPQSIVLYDKNGIKTVSYVKSYGVSVPAVSILLTSEDSVKYSNKNYEDFYDRVDIHYGGWNIDGLNKYLKYSLKQKYNNDLYIFNCDTKKPESPEDLMNECTRDSRFSGDSLINFNPYSNVYSFSKDYNKYKQKEARKSIFGYESEYRNSQFGIANCIIQVCTIVVWIVWLVLSLTCAKGSGKVSNEP